MRFTGVSVQNLKGRTFNYKLTPLTLVTGDHEEGKSSVADALRLASVGYDPRLGKRPADTIRLATGEVMTVAVEIDGRPAGNQVWKRTAKGASKDGDPAMQIPATLFDLSEFLNLTAAERSKYVFSLSDPEKIGFGIEKFLGALAAIRVNTEESEFMESIADELRMKAEDAEKAGTPTAQWLDEFYSGLDQRQKQADSAVRTFTQANRAGVLTSEEPMEIPDDVDAQLTAKRQEQKENFERMAKVREERRGVQQRIQAIDAARMTLAGEDQTDDIRRLERELEQTEIELDQIPAQDDKALKLLSDAYSKAAEEKSDIEAKLDATAQKDLEVTAELEAIIAKATCAECGQKIAAKLKKELTAEKKKQAKEVATNLKTLIKSHKIASATFAQAAERIAEFTKTQTDRSKLEEKCRRLRADIDPMKKEQAARDTAKARIDAQGDEGKLRAEYNRLGEELNVGGTKALQIQIALDSLVSQQRIVIARREQERGAAENKARREEQVREARLLKEAKEAIGTERDNLNAKVWGTLLETARKFTTGILKAGALDFYEGELGYWRADTFVTYKTFSGAQRTLAFIGVAIALCQHSPIKIVILDEVAALHKYRESVAGRLGDLIREKVIDQALIIDPDAGAYHENLFPPGMFSTITVTA